MLEERDPAQPHGEQTVVRGAPGPETTNERTIPVPHVPLVDLPTTSVSARPYLAGAAGMGGEHTVALPPGAEQATTRTSPPPRSALDPPTELSVAPAAATQKISLFANGPLERPPAVEATTVLNATWEQWATPASGTAPSVSDKQHGAAGSSGKALRRAGLVAASALGVLGLLYGIDMVLSDGTVPRGVAVAGVDVGGLSRTAAEQKLRAQIEPRLSQPIKLRAGDVSTTLDPKAAGLRLDWAATVDRAGTQPWNPLIRLASFFTSHDVGVATHTDTGPVTSALEALRPQIDRDPVEGSIHFDKATAQPVEPRPGQKVDLPKAVSAVLAGWTGGKEIEVPVTSTPVTVTADGVRTALSQIAVPAVSGPVTVNGDGKDARLEPAAIAAALTFEPNGSGGLNPKLDQAKIVGALTPQLASTEQPGADALVLIEGNQPVVKPSQDGRSVDYDKTLGGLLEVLRRTDNRTVKAQYAAKPAKVTTDQANQLGVKEVIGEFTTGGFAHDSGVNIQKVAEKVNGAIVKPGEVFSLNGYTGPRTATQGYVDAGIIMNGAPGRAVGGGISQFATTLYNASYFAGMADAGHREHSYYITRYPPAREATVFENPDGSSVIDVKFKNDGPTGVVIQAVWTPTSIIVRLWGTKRYQVESIPGEKTDFTEPNTITKKPGEPCVPGNGAQGFKTTDTRVLRDLSGHEVRRDTRSVKYDPVPKIVCSP